MNQTENNSSTHGKTVHNEQDAITKQKIDKHLMDINDTISEQDIKNVKTDIHSGGPDDHNEDEPKTMVRSELDRKEVPSPWEIKE